MINVVISKNYIPIFKSIISLKINSFFIIFKFRFRHSIHSFICILFISCQWQFQIISNFSFVSQAILFSININITQSPRLSSITQKLWFCQIWRQCFFWIVSRRLKFQTMIICYIIFQTPIQIFICFFWTSSISFSINIFIS